MPDDSGRPDLAELAEERAHERFEREHTGESEPPVIVPIRGLHYQDENGMRYLASNLADAPDGTMLIKTTVSGEPALVFEDPVEVGSIPSSQIDAASGVAKLGTDKKVGGPGGSALSASVDIGSPATAVNQLVLSAGADNTTKRQPKMRLDARDHGVKGLYEAGEGAALQALVREANERKREIWLPDDNGAGEPAKIKIDTQVLLEGTGEFAMFGGGRSTQLYDLVTGGSGIKFACPEEGAAEGHPRWEGFDLVPFCQKPTHHMVEFSRHHTAGLRIEDMHVIGDSQTNFWRILSVFGLEDMWEGQFTNVRWQEILGHELWYRCPTLTGGNMKFDSCQSIFGLSGIYIDGLFTQNNLVFENCKWASPASPASGHEYYQAFATGAIPAAGATQITVATGQESKYFPRNGCVVIFSSAGAEVLHLVSSETPYNAETGVLKLSEPIAKNHHAAEDTRLITGTFSVVTNYIVNSAEFKGCHMEQRPAVILEAPGLLMDGTSFHLNQSANTAEPRGVYYGGATSGDAHVNNSTMAHSFETYSEYAMVYGMMPTGITGNPSIEVDGVASSPTPNKASRDEPKWNPLKGDGTFLSFASQKVRTLGHGTERNTVSGDSSFRAPRKVTASASVKSNDETVNCETPTANITVTLLKLANKIVTIRKIDAVAHNVIITAGAGKTITTKAGATAETVEITAKGGCFTLWYDGTNFWEQ